MDELGFVYDPENKEIYLTFKNDDPWPVTVTEAMRMSVELATAIRQAMEDKNEPIQQ